MRSARECGCIGILHDYAVGMVISEGGCRDEVEGEGRDLVEDFAEGRRNICNRFWGYVQVENMWGMTRNPTISTIFNG
jgi:hypothetical protein